MQGDKISSEDVDVSQQDKRREMYTEVKLRWEGVLKVRWHVLSQQHYLH